MNQVAFDRGSPPGDAGASPGCVGNGFATAERSRASARVGARAQLRDSSDWPIRKILVPTDYSNECRKAMQRGMAIARQFDAELTLLHVIDITTPGGQGTAAQLMQQLWDQGSTQMAHVACSLAGKVEAQTLLAEGIPWEVIIEKSGEFDLIVLGKNGREKGWKFCSKHTARRVIENARCPVMVIDGEVVQGRF